MIKVKLWLEAEKDIPRTNWKKGDKLELINDVFDKKTGVAFWSLDLGWKINKIEVLECEIKGVLFCEEYKGKQAPPDVEPPNKGNDAE